MYCQSSPLWEKEIGNHTTQCLNGYIQALCFQGRATRGWEDANRSALSRQRHFIVKFTWMLKLTQNYLVADFVELMEEKEMIKLTDVFSGERQTGFQFASWRTLGKLLYLCFLICNMRLSQTRLEFWTKWPVKNTEHSAWNRVDPQGMAVILHPLLQPPYDNSMLKSHLGKFQRRRIKNQNIFTEAVHATIVTWGYSV